MTEHSHNLAERHHCEEKKIWEQTSSQNECCRSIFSPLLLASTMSCCRMIENSFYRNAKHFTAAGWTVRMLPPR